MKKVIISNSQLKRIYEANGVVNIAAQSKGDDLSSYKEAATSTDTNKDVVNASRAGDVNLTISGPNSNDNEPQQQINVGSNQTVADAISDQGNNELLQNGGTMKITGDGFGESKIYTKKSIEEARLKRIFLEGTVMTKGQMNKSFLKN